MWVFVVVGGCVGTSVGKGGSGVGGGASLLLAVELYVVM